MPPRRFVFATLAAVVAAAAVAGTAWAAAAAPGAKVAFMAGEQMATVARPGSSVAAAVRGLLRGPSAAERRRGITTQVPQGSSLLGVELARGVATVDLSTRFASGRDRASVSARMAQLVLTVTAVPGIRSVRLLVGGRVPPTLLRGLPASRPLTARDVREPDQRFPPPPPEPRLRPPDSTTLELQDQLAALGYLDPAAVTGRPGQQTAFAVIAFQKWEGLQRDGIAGPATLAVLATAQRPTPRTSGTGHRVEVLLDRQLALVIQDDTVLRTLHVSTGKPGYETLAGSWTIQRKYLRDWSVPYKTWLPYASYFVGGYAFHEYPEVPVSAASHGCVRTSRYDIRFLYDNTPVGTPVTVLRTSR